MTLCNSDLHYLTQASAAVKLTLSSLNDTFISMPDDSSIEDFVAITKLIHEAEKLRDGIDAALAAYPED